MGTKVETISVCEQCGCKNVREGAEGFVPPIGWAELELTYRLKGSGWTNNRRIVKVLCPRCAEEVEDWYGKGI